MKLRRYAARGRIQRKGIAATSCVRWLVTANSRMLAEAASPSHSRRMARDGGAPMAESAGVAAMLDSLAERHAVTPQSAAKQTKAADQIMACAWLARLGSMRNG